MAKKDNKSHHDKGVTLNLNRQEHANSFIQHQDPRLNQQEIAKQNLAQNRAEGNKNYEQMQMRLAETAQEFDKKEFIEEEQEKE